MFDGSVSASGWWVSQCLQRFILGRSRGSRLEPHVAQLRMSVPNFLVIRFCFYCCSIPQTLVVLRNIAYNHAGMRACMHKLVVHTCMHDIHTCRHTDVCIYIYICVCVCVCMCVYVQMYVIAYINNAALTPGVHCCVYIYMQVHTYTHAQAHAHAHTHTDIHIYIYIYMRVCVYVCI